MIVECLKQEGTSHSSSDVGTVGSQVFQSIARTEEESLFEKLFFNLRRSFSLLHCSPWLFCSWPAYTGSGPHCLFLIPAQLPQVRSEPRFIVIVCAKGLGLDTHILTETNI
ncbi:hypothetical protein AMECASPLE_017960 [Ameca splendens]|uniref:Uncharacterized protein n=1 Tax=Ameca splendens TaxID=208324 RepID=A0ABV0YQ75_9TELE